MLARLEALESDTPGISDAQIHAEWDAFVSTLTADCDSVAQMLIAVLAGIARHRPEMIESLLPDAIDPLLCLGLEDVPSILAWYAEHKRLDARVRQWVSDTLPPHLERLDID